jgi:uncharacterized protein involved in exopolysaccharide biosynthesis
MSNKDNDIYEENKREFLEEKADAAYEEYQEQIILERLQHNNKSIEDRLRELNGSPEDRGLTKEQVQDLMKLAPHLMSYYNGQYNN